MKSCANCEKSIGNLEPTFMNGNYEVCAECYKLLKPKARIIDRNSKRSAKHFTIHTIIKSTVAVFAFFMLIVLSSRLYDSGYHSVNQSNQVSGQRTNQNIVYAARRAVKQCLRSPDSASFPAWPDTAYKIGSLENDAYMVSGVVTAKNAFGVKLRDPWKVRLEFAGNNVRATYVKIGDSVIVDVQ